MSQRIKGGFGQVSNTVLRDPDISLGEKALYAYLCTYADSDTDELYVGINRIAAECNLGVSTAKRHLCMLEKKGVIMRIRRGQGMSSITKLIK